MKKLLVAFFLLGLMIQAPCVVAQSLAKVVHPQLVIFDTDMGNDVDDAMALDLLFKYMDAGSIKLLAIMSNKPGEASARYIDIMNTWYGYPNIPIGIVREGAKCDIQTNYAEVVCNMKDNDGKPLFKTSVPDVTKLPDAENLYRKVLAAQPDHSVVIISTGFSTNLARLLNTKSDSYSKLSGEQLVAKKVKYLSIMAGNFNGKKMSEYNVVLDIASCAKLFESCPVPIVTSPFELGSAVKYPASSIENDFKWAAHHPMIEGYKAYKPMPYDRPTWDVTSVLEVVYPGEFMTRSAVGNIFVDPKGRTFFTPSMDGKHQYLTITKEQGEKIKKYFVKMLPVKPKNYK